MNLLIYLLVNERNDDMTGKILDEILVAEKNASEIRKNASNHASQIVSDAKLRGETLCREVRDAADAKKAHAITEARKKSEELCTEAKINAENKALIVCAAASANIPDALNLIIGKVGLLWQ